MLFGPWDHIFGPDEAESGLEMQPLVAWSIFKISF